MRSISPRIEDRQDQCAALFDGRTDPVRYSITTQRRTVLATGQSLGIKLDPHYLRQEEQYRDNGQQRGMQRTELERMRMPHCTPRLYE